MDNQIKVLDHGYVQLVETWGSEERIIEAARMSTGKGFKEWGPLHSDRCHRGFDGTPKEPGEKCCEDADGDEKLLAYLYTHKHSTPFEMAGLVIEVKAPIFVFREWHRHRTQSYNEMSARYIPLPDENYMPSIARIVSGAAPTGNRQAQGVAAPADAETAEAWLRDLEQLYRDAQAVYESGLRRGIPKELARLPVPVARYSRMRASANLRNWLAFLTLRMAPAAQWEIRQFADAVGQLVSEHFPRTWELFASEQS